MCLAEWVCPLLEIVLYFVLCFMVTLVLEYNIVCHCHNHDYEHTLWKALPSEFLLFLQHICNYGIIYAKIIFLLCIQFSQATLPEILLRRETFRVIILTIYNNMAATRVQLPFYWHYRFCCLATDQMMVRSVIDLKGGCLLLCPELSEHIHIVDHKFINVY